MIIDIDLTEEQQQKLIILGFKAILEKVDLLDFPSPEPEPEPAPESKSKGRKWTPERRRKFKATMKRKRAQSTE